MLLANHELQLRKLALQLDPELRAALLALLSEVHAHAQVLRTVRLVLHTWRGSGLGKNVPLPLRMLAQVLNGLEGPDAPPVASGVTLRAVEGGLQAAVESSTAERRPARPSLRVLPSASES